MDLVEELATRVDDLVDHLDDAGRRLALLPFDDDDPDRGGERRDWAYWPTDRRGVPLWSLDRVAEKAAHRILSTLLAPAAFARAVTIMGLDEVLDEQEGFRGGSRHRGDYWISIFGRPSAGVGTHASTESSRNAEPWGVRFEGHHVSVHATIVDREVHLTPLFLGANPAVVHDGPHEVIAPLALEERLGFELFHALTVGQQASARIADTAPDDIATRNAPRIDEPSTTEGVPIQALTGAAARTAAELVDVYLSRLPARARRPDPAGARFAWAGAAEPGTGHYYRVAAPRLLIELDNTQNEANHVHTVLRDPGSDFGGDALAEHHRHAHARDDAHDDAHAPTTSTGDQSIVLMD